MYNHSGTVAVTNPGIYAGHISRNISADKRRIRIFTSLTAGILVVVILLSMILRPTVTFAKTGSAGPVYESVRIEAGDTMWDIVSRYADTGAEVRSLVRQIEKINHISADFIYEGQYLIIPVSSGT